MIGNCWQQTVDEIKKALKRGDTVFVKKRRNNPLRSLLREMEKSGRVRLVAESRVQLFYERS